MKKAFTLFELIVVIVIVGILSLFGINIAIEIYKNYFNARAINSLETKTELTLEQISKRLAIRVKGSTIGRNTEDYSNFVSSQDSTLSNKYKILEWISYSYESFQDGGWSGFVDMDHANTIRNAGKNGGTLQTPASNLNNASTDISNLTNGKATLSNEQVGLMFKTREGLNVETSFGFNKTNQADSIATVKMDAPISDDTLKIENYTKNEIYEQYYLLHTAYAVVPEKIKNSDTDFRLWLYYNYRPWIKDQKYKKGYKALLAEHVTRFNFTDMGGTIVLKLCIRDAGSSLEKEGKEATVCKTKAVY